MNEDTIVAETQPACAAHRRRLRGRSASSRRGLLFTTDFSIEGVHFTRESRPEADRRGALWRAA